MEMESNILFSDRELVEVARESIQKFSMFYFYGLKDMLLTERLNKQYSEYVETILKGIDRERVENLLISYKDYFYEWFLIYLKTYTGLHDYKSLYKELDLIYSSKREQLKDIEAFIRKRFLICNDRVDICEKPLAFFLLKFCMKYNLLFDKKHKYDAFYHSLIKKMCKTETQMIEIMLMLRGVYFYNNYVNTVAPYFGIDVDRCLAFNVDIREQLINIIELETLNAGDIRVDDKFNVVFIKNQDRWKCIANSICLQQLR